MFRFFFFLYIMTSLLAKEEDISTVSETMGHLIRKNLDSLGIKLDMDLVIKGIKSDQEPPLSEDECLQSISTFQEIASEEKAKSNLEKADAFLSQNLKQEDIVQLQPNKLQYKVLKQGTGATVQEHSSPLLTYQGSYLDGTVFGHIEEPETVPLDEALPGLRKAIVGMKEHEKRRIYIHPDLGYKKDHFKEPNALLIFDVEIIQADHTNTKPNSYISEISEVIR